jgi:hypothetical protein
MPAKKAKGAKKDPKTCEYAQAVRTMIVHEDDLLNNRMNWLLVVQGLLFAALGSLKDSSPQIPGLIYVLIAFGFLISISSKIAFVSSDRAIQTLLTYWDMHLKATRGRWQDYPPIFGAELQNRMLMQLDRFLSPRNLLPWAFALGWLVILVLKLRS